MLLNVITESMISMPAKIADLYEDLPESSRLAIEKRDGKVLGTSQESGK